MLFLRLKQFTSWREKHTKIIIGYAFILWYSLYEVCKSQSTLSLSNTNLLLEKGAFGRCPPNFLVFHNALLRQATASTTGISNMIPGRSVHIGILFGTFDALGVCVWKLSWNLKTGRDIHIKRNGKQETCYCSHRTVFRCEVTWWNVVWIDL